MLAALTEFIDKDEIYALSTMVEAQIEQSQVKISMNDCRNFFFFFARNFFPIIFIMMMSRFWKKN
jgi:hypothetical protein